MVTGTISHLVYCSGSAGTGIKVHESWDDVSSNTNLDLGSFGSGMLGSVASVRVDVAVGVY